MRPWLIPFKAQHLQMFPIREVSDLTQAIQNALLIEDVSPAYTAVVQDSPESIRVIGCGGIVVLWPGVAQAWTVLSDEISGSKIWAHRMVKRILVEAAELLQVVRIQTNVRADSERNVRWIESLGFTREGLMRKFGPEGGDYYLYARLYGKPSSPVSGESSPQKEGTLEAVPHG